MLSSAGQAERLSEFIQNVPLLDNHCHSVLVTELSLPQFEDLLTEAPDRSAAVTSVFDSSAGLTMLRHCSKVLGVTSPLSPDDYIKERSLLGGPEVSRRMLEGTHSSGLLVDAAYSPLPVVSLTELAALSGANVREIVRLESLAEGLLSQGISASKFPTAYREAISSCTENAAGFKSVAAYRCGLEVLSDVPDDKEVVKCVEALIDRSPNLDTARVSDSTLISFLVHVAVELTSLPIQFHVGYGDPDLRLDRSNPALLTDFIRKAYALGSCVVLLHCYPYHREAAYLANVFPNVYFDLGLTLNYVGFMAPQVMAESLQLAPYAKMMYSSDAFGLAELYFLGSEMFRLSIREFLVGLIQQDLVTFPTAERFARMFSFENAVRLYKL